MDETTNPSLEDKKPKKPVVDIFATISLNEDKILKSQSTTITVMTRVVTLRNGDGTIRQSTTSDSKSIPFKLIRQYPRYYMRLRNLWSWFILTKEQMDAYKGLTVHDCQQLDKKYGGVS